MYSKKVLEQFQNQSHVGEIPDATAYVQVENPGCGDTLHLSVKMRDGQVADVRFRVRGCVAAIACAAQLAEMMDKRKLTEIRSITRDDIVTELGGLDGTSVHASYLVEDALRGALDQIEAMRKN
jgi:nitrogen fixation NifU-like protein